ncbi:MAG: PASTA domain-containing protein [Pseudomonadota bacterium]
MIKRLFRMSFLLIIFVGIAGISTYLTLAVFLKGSDRVTVPDLKGIHVVPALEILSDLSLNIKVSKSEYSDDVPRYYVIRQEPESGIEVKKGRDVRLVLSNGSLTLFAPDLKGLSIQQARIVLEENGLCSGDVAITYSAQFNNDVVMAQSPGAGAKTKRDRCVNILVSGGARPREYAMPELTGMLLEDAMLLMDNCKLRLGNITKRKDRIYRPDGIVYQEPAPGHRVEENEVVNLVINRAPDENAVTIPTAPRLKLFSYRLEDGFLNSHIKLQLNTFGTTFDLYDDFLKPGEEIWFFVPDSDNSTLLLFHDDELVLTKDFDLSAITATY